VPAQIDTAADLTVIPAGLVDELGLLPLDSVSALGFGGHLVTLPTFLVEIQIRDMSAAIVKVIASPDEPYTLLGRDVLNRFSILLDGPNLVLEVR
jgi:predicted aspartyl protease